jgi:hypothetical protein
MEYIAISLQANAENVGDKVDFIVFEEGYTKHLLLNNLMRAMTSSIEKVT